MNIVKRFFSFIISTRFTAILFLTFALSMGIGTFVESIYDTETARFWIYNARWFEMILFLFMINFMVNIKRYHLLKREKWAILLLHLSLIIIILGAFVTRYFGFEGIMPIREQQTIDYFYSDKTYLNITVDGEIDETLKRKNIKVPLLLSNYSDNRKTISDKFKNTAFSITIEKYYKYAKKDIIKDSLGSSYLKIVESKNGSRHEHFIKDGDKALIHNLVYTLNNPSEGAVNIITKSDAPLISLPYDAEVMTMATKETANLKKGVSNILLYRSLYTFGEVQFVIPSPPIKGNLDVVKTNKNDLQAEEALILNLKSENNYEKRIFLFGGKGKVYEPIRASTDKLDFGFQFGSILHQLPFSIKLNDFIAKKYPGTERSYLSFKSKITVIDKLQESFNYDIYMNHVLDYKGYRFFQSSFDPDEMGTVLSVNHDALGTGITYSGYFLLYLAMMGIMFYGKTRFRQLGEHLRKLQKKRYIIIFIMLTCSFMSQAQYESDTHKKDTLIHSITTQETTTQDKSYIDSLIKVTAIPKEQALKLGTLIIQDDNGRMKPIHTFSSELIRKLSKKESLFGLNPNQIMASILQNPIYWYYAEVIYLKKGNDSIRKILGVDAKKKYTALVTFFDEKGNYKLGPFLEKAYSKANPNKFEKDIKDIDLKLGMFNRTLEGEIFKVFPIPNHPNDKWISFRQTPEINTYIKDSLYRNFVKNAISFYLISLKSGKQEGDFHQADKIMDAIKTNQKKYSTDIMPSDQRVDVEILYNQINIFSRLFLWDFLVGFLLIVITIIGLFKSSKIWNYIATFFKYLIYTFFICHTLGLVARWYISGHAPWSDAYESMIYVAWATMGMGILFAKKSTLTLASTTFVASMVLMVAHWNWLDPEISLLQPVLNSYWLMIHVAIIVASYGPFTVGAFLGLLILLLFMISNAKNISKLKPVVRELTLISELSLTVGLVMLTIGNFLGGQWANESWGRYWGWDPKETWALISIMVYAFVLHMRLIPGLRNLFAYNLSALLAYGAILMTYFGVNFYLAGLHSYASGDKVVTPSFVYNAVVFIFIIALLAYYKYNKYWKKTPNVSR